MNYNYSLRGLMLLAVTVCFAIPAWAEDTGSIHGTVWVNNYRSDGATVYIYYDHNPDSRGRFDFSKLIATAEVDGGETYRLNGTYEIDDLPVGVTLLAVAVDSDFPNSPAVRTFELRSGQDKQISLTVSVVNDEYY